MELSDAAFATVVERLKPAMRQAARGFWSEVLSADVVVEGKMVFAPYGGALSRSEGSGA